MKLPKIFQGIGGDALTGVAMAAAVGANPLLGLLATPYLADRRKGMEIGRKGREIENEMGQLKLDTFAGIPSILQNQNAGVNPVTGEPVAMEEGLTPYDTTGQRLQAAAMFPGMSSVLFPEAREGGRLNQAELLKLYEAYTGQKATPEQVGQIMGMNGQGGDNELRLLMDQVNLRLAADRLERETEDRKLAERERKRTIESANVDMRNSARGTREALDALQTLVESSSSMKPGSGWADAVRAFEGGKAAVRDFFGADTEESYRMMTAYDKLKKNLAIATADTVGGFDRLGQMTDVKFNVARDAAPDMGITAEAMRDLLLNNLEGRLDAVRIGDTGYAGYDADMEYLIEQRKKGGYNRPAGVGADVVDGVSDIWNSLATGAEDVGAFVQSQVAELRAKSPDVTEQDIAELEQFILEKIREAEAKLR